MPRVSDEAGQHGLTRERVVRAGLELVHDEGLDALSMRALAERLDVKAASLYWHFRDRRELLDLLAAAILDSVPRPRAGGWRSIVAHVASGLARRSDEEKDAARLLLESPGALQASDLNAAMKRSLVAAGLPPAEAGDVAMMAMLHAIAGRAPRIETTAVPVGGEAAVAIDSGSRGVLMRAGEELETLFRIGRDRGTAAPAIVRGETVIVRRLRGVGLGEVELSRRHAWRIRIQGPTWNTVVEGGGLDLREIKLDSGAAKVECFLPRPRGVVPIIVSGGVVGVTLHRPAGVGVVADISTGAVNLKLDAFATRAVVQDVHWQSEDAAGSADRYALRINGGAVQVHLDSNMAGHEAEDESPEPAAPADAEVSALEILLDGVEARIAARRSVR